MKLLLQWSNYWLNVMHFKHIVLSLGEGSDTGSEWVEIKSIKSLDALQLILIG